MISKIEAAVENDKDTKSAIQVDDANYSTANWTTIYFTFDTLVSFSQNCSTVSAVNEIEVNQSEITIYPNPANEAVNVVNIPNNSSLKIIDISGKTVYHFTTLKTTEKVNTENFGNGIYFIQVDNRGAVTNKKLVVSR